MRRIIAFIMTFIAFPICASAEILAINAKNSCAVTDEAGNMLFDCSGYDMIFPLKNKNGVITGYAAGISAQDESIFYALVSPRGTKLTRHAYSCIEAAGNGFIACLRDKWYCLSANGTIVGEGYSGVEYVGGAAFAVSGDPYDEIADDLLLLYPGGSIIETGVEIQYGLGEFSEGLMPLVSGDTLLSGYVDAGGQWAISPSFSYAAAFSGGIAVVAGKSGYGVINTAGDMVIPAEYSFISRQGDKFCCIKDDTAYIIASDGGVISETPLDGASAQPSGEFLILTRSDGVDVLDATGAHMFTLGPGLSIEACDNLFIVRTAESAYVAGTDGLAVSPEYDVISHLDGDIFACGNRSASGDIQYGLLRASDGEITGCRYDSIALAGPGLYAATDGNTILLINNIGKVIPVR